MFCSRCGENQVDAPTFCRGCGEKLRTPNIKQVKGLFQYIRYENELAKRN